MAILIGNKKYLLGRFLGSYKSGRICVIAAAVAKDKLRRGEPLGIATDKLDCACPALQDCLLVINDYLIWDSDEERTEVLGPWIDRLIDSRNDSKIRKRVFQMVDAAIRIDAADHLDLIDMRGEADRLRLLQPITDIKTAKTAIAEIDRIPGLRSKVADIAKLAATYLTIRRYKYAEVMAANNVASAAALLANRMLPSKHKYREICDRFLSRLAQIYGFTD